MISFSSPLALLLAVPLAAATAWVWRTGHVPLSRQRARWALAIRLLLIGAFILGIAGAGLRLPQNREAVVFVVDRSASDLAQAGSAQSLIGTALAHRPGGNLAGIVSTARQAEVEQPVSPLGSFGGFQTSVSPDYTNMEAGMQLAGAILPDGYRRRVVVIGDGQQNAGDALAEARLLRTLGIRVDVAPVHVAGGPEVLVDGVTMPSALRPQERFTLTVAVSATIATTTRLDLYRDRTLIATKQESLHPGQNTFSFDEQPLRPGFHTFTAQLTPAVDSQPENNSGSAFTLVAGPPKILVVSPAKSEAQNVLNSLHSTGITADFVPPAKVIPSLAYLQRYAALVLVDTPVDELDPSFVGAILPYVRDLGHGLVVIGGREAYGMGGYGQTPLEQALPVKMDLPKRRDLPSAAVVLIIENLEADYQVNISKQAGKGVVDLLTEGDQIAVTDALGDGSFVVPLQHVRNKGAIDAAIDNMEPGDPVSYAPDLQSAYNVLRHAQARVKHIILLGDGDAEDPAYEGLVKKIHRNGITVSTVATNGLGFNDFQTMQNIARWGGGRYYRGDDPTAIPQIFLREARTVARSGIIEGTFYPQELSANPMLSGIKSIPPLTGYVATTPKPTGEMVLVSKKLDPVLAAWQLGLGRSVAWTSDASGEWTRQWLAAPGAQRFWSNLVSWTLPSTQGGHLFVATGTQGGQGQVAVDTPASLGASPAVTARIVGPDQRTSTIQLQPSAPGHFRGTFAANAQGAYFVAVDARGASHSEAGSAGLDVPYSAEYRTTGTNLAFLKQLAVAGGGSVMKSPDDAWADNLPSAVAQRDLSLWFWLLAILLLPIDIGIRRLIVTRSDIAAILAAVRPGRRLATAEPAVAPLSALRSRRAAQRSAAIPLVATGPPDTAPSVGTLPGTPGVSPARAASVRGNGHTSLGSPPARGNPVAADSSRAGTSTSDEAKTSQPPSPPEESTTGRLLAAKRRRK